MVLPSAATTVVLHRDSGLLAVICDDLVVRIVDIETRRVVRELGGFRGRILDVVRDSASGSNATSHLTNRIDSLSGLALAGRSVSRFDRPHI